MQKAVLLLFLFAFFGSQAQLQLHDGSLALRANSSLTIDGLSFTPSTNLAIASTVMTKSATPVALNSSVYSINRVWSLSSPIEFTGLLRFTYDPAGLNAHSEGALKLSFRTDNVWRPSPNGVVNASRDYIEETIGAKIFNGLTASAPYAVLPLSLLSFTARLQASGAVLLEWQTALERNNRSFTVQRSPDGEKYENIGVIPGASNSNGQGYYQLMDPAPLRGQSYYQLRQMDQNGQEQSLGIRVMKTRSEQTKAFLFPNPVFGSELNLSFAQLPAKPLAYSIIAAGGQLVKTGQLSHQYQSIIIGDLAAGTYFLQLAQGQTIRFQKQ